MGAPAPPTNLRNPLRAGKRALVRLRDQEGQITKRTHTDANGKYQFQSLPIDREFTLSAIDLVNLPYATRVSASSWFLTS